MNLNHLGQHKQVMKYSTFQYANTIIGTIKITTMSNPVNIIIDGPLEEAQENLCNCSILAVHREQRQQK